MSRISAIILAGGEGKRVGGLDKGLLEWRGKPMIQHIIESISDQTDEIVISCNRNLDRYRKYGVPLVSDKLEGYQGPLAGLLSACTSCQHDFVLVVPCDCPQLPSDLAQMLYNNLGDSDVSVAHDGNNLQPLFMLMRKEIIRTIDIYLKQGKRSVRGWLDCHSFSITRFDDLFHNINEIETLNSIPGKPEV